MQIPKQIKQLSCILVLLAALASCNPKTPSGNTDNSKTPPTAKLNPASAFSCIIPDTAFQTKQDIIYLYDDRAGNFWIATYGDGVYKYDGKHYTHLTEKEGLPNNFVCSIIDDSSGNMWFCSKADGVCRYDGKTFSNFKDTNNQTDNRSGSCSIRDKKGNLWFGTGGGAYRYNGKTFSYWPLPMEGADIELSKTQPGFNTFPYTVYHMLEDKNGNIWLGTAGRGMCCYNGMFCTWYKDKGLGKAAMRSVFMDHKGVLWFGNNGAGVVRYDGKTFTNITDEQNLGNPDFLKGIGVPDRPGTMARVFAISEDNKGNTWFGTLDAGAWRYDGKKAVNFTTKDGLPGNVVHAIFKDKSGNLWQGTNGGGLCRYEGDQ